MATLYIKNMVCNRCIIVVQNELDKLGLGVKNIKLGEVILDKERVSCTGTHRPALPPYTAPCGTHAPALPP